MLQCSFFYLISNGSYASCIQYLSTYQHLPRKTPKCIAIQNIPAPCNMWNHEISISSPLIHSFHLPGYGGLSETTYVGIYTLSTLVEQSTPAILEIVDAYATVMGTFFVDKARWQMAMGMGFTIWLFNIAMENGPFIEGL